ncbi:hypothetical protein B0T24DRAFT_683181 [Lasiosphaeria ovina]|uniref:Uncharacterized protein n=1 Tax=Lasiosphaeria ovina TaxID=92902 RepID=A0AAE0N1L6_9PEZI|nr:hypothetical protein B0T24DRAFT_683181 [Lasiosphaeria ovina]
MALAGLVLGATAPEGSAWDEQTLGVRLPRGVASFGVPPSARGGAPPPKLHLNLDNPRNAALVHALRQPGAVPPDYNSLTVPYLLTMKDSSPDTVLPADYGRLDYLNSLDTQDQAATATATPRAKTSGHGQRKPGQPKRRDTGQGSGGAESSAPSRADSKGKSRQDGHGAKARPASSKQAGTGGSFLGISLDVRSRGRHGRRSEARGKDGEEHGDEEGRAVYKKPRTK